MSNNRRNNRRRKRLDQPKKQSPIKQPKTQLEELIETYWDDIDDMPENQVQLIIPTTYYNTIEAIILL